MAKKQNPQLSDDSPLVFRRAFKEWVYHAPALALSLAAAAGCFWGSGVYFWPWGVLTGLGFTLISGIFAGLLLRLRHRALWRGDPPVLEVKTWGRVDRFELAALESVVTVPAWGRTALKSGRIRGILRHQFLGTEFLLDQIRLARPDLFPLPQESLVLKVSRVGLLFQVVFVAVILAASLLLFELGWFAALAAAVLAIFPALRLLRKTPRSFFLDSEGIQVKAVWGRKKFAWSQLTDWSEDTYASAGCSYYLMRLKFGEETVVLDEGHLLTSLRLNKSWIIDRLLRVC
ncbi:MAG: hypothetical protein HKM06_01415 [Spirochaetales bacterium]|nr:hypothetical protein [Spirochaetales bacterium]